MADQDNLMMLLGLDEEQSSALINEQIQKIAMEMDSILIDVKLDEAQVTRIRQLVEGIGGDFRNLSEIIRKSSDFKIDNKAFAGTREEIAQLQKQLLATFGSGATIKNWSVGAEGAIVGANVEIRNANNELQSFKAVLQDGEWMKSSNINVKDLFVQEISESLKAFRQFQSEINKINTKEAMGTATEDQMAVRASLEKQATEKIEQAYQSLNRAKEKGIINAVELENRTKQLADTVKNMSDKSDVGLINALSGKDIKDAEKTIAEYKKSYTELIAIQQKQEKGEGTSYNTQRAKELEENLRAIEKSAGLTEQLGEKLKTIKNDFETKELKIIDEEEIAKSNKAIADMEKAFKDLSKSHERLLKAQGTDNKKAQKDASIDYEMAQRKVDSYRDSLGGLTDDELQRARLAESFHAQEAAYAEQKEARLNKERQLLEVVEEQFIETYGKQFKAKEGFSSKTAIGDVKSTEELQKYLKELGYVNAEVTNFNDSARENGRVLAQANVVLDSKANKLQHLKVSIDGSTNALRAMSTGTTMNVSRMMSFQNQVEKATQKIMAFSLAGAALYGTMRKIREGVEFINELDKALTQVAIVQGTTREQVAYLAKDYADLGAAMGKTVTEIAHVNTELVRQGLTLKESEARMKTILQLSSVGAISADESLRIVTTSVNALRVGHERAADVIVKASQISASSVEQIGEAFTKTASSAFATGMQLEQVGSILSTLIETTQEGPSQLGTSLKTILARFSRVNEETGEFNENLNDVQSAIESVGVSFTDSDGQIRNVYDVLRDLSGEWKSLTKNQQAYVATQAAGVRQQNRFYALMNNFNRTQEIHNELLYSAGTLTAGYATYLTSLEAAGNRAQVAMEKLWIELIDSDTVSSVLGFLTEVLTLLEKIGATGTVLGILFSGVMMKNATAVSNLGKTLLGLRATMVATTAATGASAGALKLMTGGLLAVGKAMTPFLVGAAPFLAVAVAIGLIAKAVKNEREEVEKLRQARLAEADDYIKRRNNINAELNEIKNLEEQYEKFQRQIAQGTGTAETTLNQEELEAYYETTSRLIQLIPSLETVTNSTGREVVKMTESFVSFANTYLAKTEEMRRKLGEDAPQLINDIIIKEDANKAIEGIDEYIDTIEKLKSAEIKYLEAVERSEQPGFKLRGQELYAHNKIIQDYFDMTRAVEDFEKANKDLAITVAKQALPPMIARFENLNSTLDKFPDELVLALDDDDFLYLASILDDEDLINDFFENLINASSNVDFSGLKGQLDDLNTSLSRNEISQKDYNKALLNMANGIKAEIDYRKEQLKYSDKNIETKEKEIALLEQFYGLVSSAAIDIEAPNPVSFEDNLKQLTKFNEDLEKLDAAFVKVSKSEKIYAEELNELLLTFPELADAFAATGDATFEAGNLLTEVAKTARAELLRTLRTALWSISELDKTVERATNRSQNIKGADEMPLQYTDPQRAAQLKALIAQIDAEEIDLGRSTREKMKLTAQYFDLTATALANLELKIAKANAKYEDAFTLEEKEMAIEELIEWRGEEIDLFKQALSAYQSELDKEISKIQMSDSGLSIDQILLGDVALPKWGTYNEDMKEAISNAQSLNDTMNDLKSSMDESKKSINEYELEKMALEYERLEKVISKTDKSLEAVNHQLALTSEDNFAQTASLNAAKMDILAKSTNSLYDELIRLSGEYHKEGTREAEEHERQMELLTQKIREQEQEMFSLGQSATESFGDFKSLVRELVESEMAELIEAHQKQTEEAKEYLDTQLAQIDAEQKLLEYEKNKAGILRTLNQLRSKEASLQIAAAQGDRKAQALLQGVQDQIIAEEEKKEDLISKNAIEKQKETLKETFDEFKDIKDKEIELIQNTLNNAEKMNKIINTRIAEAIDGNMEKLLTQLDEYNLQHGDGIKNSIIDRWEEVLKLVKEYNVETGKITFSNFSQSSMNTGVGYQGGTTNLKAETIARMHERSSQWSTATAEQRLALNKDNQKDALGIGYKYYEQSGHYFPENMTDEQIRALTKQQFDELKLYDNGGFKPKGTWGLMGEDSAEWMLTDAQFRNSQKTAIKDFIDEMSGTYPIAPKEASSVTININGDISDDNVAKISKDITGTLEEINKGQLKAWRSRGVKPTGRV